MRSVRLSKKNTIVIPLAVREKLDISGGDRLVIDKVTDIEVVLKKQPSYFDLIGSLPKGKDDSVKRVRQVRDTWQ